MSRTTLKIEGMTCGHCVMTVKKALDGLEGVSVESISIGTATLSYNPALSSAEGIAAAISKTGYAATAAG